MHLFWFHLSQLFHTLHWGDRWSFYEPSSTHLIYTKCRLVEGVTVVAPFDRSFAQTLTARFHAIFSSCCVHCKHCSYYNPFISHWMWSRTIIIAHSDLPTLCNGIYIVVPAFASRAFLEHPFLSEICIVRWINALRLWCSDLAFLEFAFPFFCWSTISWSFR